MPDLPEDLTAILLEQVYYAANFRPDVATLKSCALVSSSWSAQSQKLLFRSIRFHNNPHDNRKLQHFLGAIDPLSERGRYLGSCVRTIDIHVSERGTVHCSVLDFRFILENCPRLYEVILSIDMHQFDDTTMDALRTISADSGRGAIRALTLRCGVQSPILYQLLQLWPTVQFLRIATELAAPPPSQPLTAQFYELVLFRVPTQAPFTWLLSNSLQSLEIVDFRELPEKCMDHLLESLGPRLRSLRLLRYNSRAAAVVKFFTKLEELVLFQLSSFLGLENLPQTLEHLSFRNFPWSSSPSLQSVISAIDTLPQLRIVSCDSSTKDHPDFPLLSLKCSERNIKLLTDASPLFVSLEDPVPVVRFPRRKSVANFALMN
ncbi:hypothetical protein OBBRIDRAFT_729172 [Obba rivulosa]|uniref:F-box domain-containing protein n=1 Tax=Obba rivulosa TaxID=1052685 RepID=A0A8E2DNS7_9APHY|nr:hypothetical protein OBBRIDRAFT_729172 [Obba rivulosa]